MKKVLITVLLAIVTLLSYCSDNKPKMAGLKPNKTTYYYRYFRRKRIYSLNQYRHLETKFENEIIGTADEILQARKSIEQSKGSYYQVRYSPTHFLLGYGYYEKGYLTVYAQYKYFDEESHLVGKIRRIEYYNDQRKKIAHEEISYNQFGRAIKTTRYLVPGNKLLNIF